MAKRSVTLKFPGTRVGEPVISRLLRSRDIEVNILHARIEPSEEGRMLAQLEGEALELDLAVKDLRLLGVDVMPTESSFIWRSDRCVHCGACAGVCPSGALSLDAGSFEVSFDLSSCIACGLCVQACFYGAVIPVEQYVAGREAGW
jgi:ferredoxin